jgi:hypothetical protein
VNRFGIRLDRLERLGTEPGLCTHGMAPARPSLLAFVEGADLSPASERPEICPLCNRRRRRRPQLSPSDCWPPPKV